MTVSVGYEPARIESLDRHTRNTIDTLRHLRSDDPAAAVAMQSIVATIRVLSDHWMPLITTIRASEIMINWRRSALAAVNQVGTWGIFPASAERFEAMSSEQLIAEVFALNQHWPSGPGRADGFELGSIGAWAALMHELEVRVAADADFGEILIDTAGDVDVLLLFLARGSFPTHLVIEGARSVVDRPDSVGSLGLRRALLIDALLARVADDPDAALDFLLDVTVATRIVAFDDGLDIWVNRPETPGVSALVHAGLVEAPTAFTDRRDDGFRALSWFIEQANDMPIDRDGFPPGVALGLAVAMQHYVPTFIHSIDGADDVGPLLESGIHADRNGDQLDDTLTTYEEMTDFFGALLHAPHAATHLGVLLAVTADDVASRRTSLSEAAHLAGLVSDAARNEDLEAAIATAARAAQRGRVVDVLATAAKVGAIAAGAGGAAKAVFGATTGFVADLTITIGGDKGRTTTLDPGSLTRHLVQMASIRRLTRDRAHRRDLDIAPAPAAWNDVGRQLDELDRLMADGASVADLQTARQRVFNRVRELGGGTVIDKLDEHGTLAILPDRTVSGD